MPLGAGGQARDRSVLQAEKESPCRRLDPRLSPLHCEDTCLWFQPPPPPTPGAAPENEYTYFTWLCLQSSISCPSSTFTHSTHSRQVCEHLLWASARAQTRKCDRATGERPGGAGALTEQGRIPLSILA